MLALLLQTIEQYLQHLNQATVKLPDQKAVPWDKKKKKKTYEINEETQEINNCSKVDM